MVRTNFCTIKVLFITSLALIVILVAILGLSFLGIPLIIKDQVYKSVRLEDGTIQWDRFLELPFAMDFKVWVYNVSNPDEILNGATPKLMEIGPYFYSQTRKKDILSTNSSEDTVRFQQHMKMTFNQELSGDLRSDDEVTVLNPVILSMSQITTALERMAMGGCLNKIFKEEYNKLFITIKAHTLFFDGLEFAINSDDVGVACGIIRKKILEKTASLKNIRKVYADEVTTVPNIEETTTPQPTTESTLESSTTLMHTPEVHKGRSNYGREVDNYETSSEIHSLKFSYFNYKISEPDGIYTTVRGLNDISKLGHVIRWNDETHLTNWGRMQSINNDTCAEIRGTDSTIYPPYITSDSFFEIFATDVCRTVRINYKGKGTYKGVDAYRFEPEESTLWSATASSENDCYCTKLTSDENANPSCFLDGVMDLKPCIGAPIVLSFPHFLHADEKYINGIEGIVEADKSLHGIYLLVEPNTGTPLEGKKRVQLNAILRPASFMKITEKLPRTTIPLIWIEEGVSLPQEFVDELNEKYFQKLQMADGIKYALIAVSVASLVTSTGFLLRKKYFTGK